MPIAPAAVEVLTALTGVLPRWGRWYLFGAQAVVARHTRGREMDASRIASVLAELEQALGQSDLSPVFDAIRRSD